MLHQECTSRATQEFLKMASRPAGKILLRASALPTTCSAMARPACAVEPVFSMTRASQGLSTTGLRHVHKPVVDNPWDAGIFYDTRIPGIINNRFVDVTP